MRRDVSNQTSSKIYKIQTMTVKRKKVSQRMCTVTKFWIQLLILTNLTHSCAFDPSHDKIKENKLVNDTAETTFKSYGMMAN